jgi:hypothetical protein
VLWGEFRFDLTPSNGEPITSIGRFSSTWAKIDGRWRDVFNHYTAV